MTTSKTAPAKTKPVAKEPAVRKKTVSAAKKEPLKSPAPASAAKTAKAVKIKKPRLVRDSFTMPEAEYDVLAQVKKACISAGFEIKKSELLRIGISLLQSMDTKKIQLLQSKLLPLKAGRPVKNK